MGLTFQNTLVKRNDYLSGMIDRIRNRAIAIRNALRVSKAVTKEISFAWEGSREGYYSLRLISQSGEKVYSRKLWIDGMKQVVNFTACLKKGAYRLEVFDPINARAELTMRISF